MVASLNHLTTNIAPTKRLSGDVVEYLIKKIYQLWYRIIYYLNDHLVQPVG